MSEKRTEILRGIINKDWKLLLDYIEPLDMRLMSIDDDLELSHSDNCEQGRYIYPKREKVINEAVKKLIEEYDGD